MGKHNHATCEHDLRWCRHCDTAYCTRCDIEWTRGGIRYWPAVSPWYGTALGAEPSGLTGGNISMQSNVGLGSHADLAATCEHRGSGAR